MEMRYIEAMPGWVVSSCGMMFRPLRSGLYKRVHPIRKSTGYLRVLFRKVWYPVHRMVLIAWDRPPVGDEECDHINRVREDNRVSNLRWVSKEFNLSRPKLEYRRNPYYTGRKILGQ